MPMQMDELACFAPGMIALGSSGYGPGDSEKFLSLAEEVFLLSHFGKYINTQILCKNKKKEHCFVNSYKL